jgi:chemotaxis protein methyltransferase CheR
VADAHHRITVLLEARCGFTPAVQHDRLAAFLAERPGREQDSLADRLDLADEQDPEWQTLIEAMLVHETYFYRHPDQLDVFAREVVPGLAEQRRTMQVWCAGCSTGEEAYTLAFLLRDAGCPARILATDLSADSVAVARQGIYRRRPGLNSFRAMPDHAWRHFDSVADEPDGWAVGQAARRTVDFAVGNLMLPRQDGLSAELISCRNTLIYFGPSGLRQVEAMLVAASRPGTVLLLGPAERLRYTDVFQPLTPSHPQILWWPR